MKKRTWEDKVFDFILRTRSSHLTNVGQEDKIYVGEHIIHKNPVRGKILIAVNQKAMRRFAFFACLVGLILAFTLVRHAAFSWMLVAVLFFLLLPFAAMGLSRYYASKQPHRGWYIDLDKKIFSAHYLAIPFDRIDHFSTTRLIDPNEVIGFTKTDYSYQLHIRMKDGKEIMLFTDDHHWDITETGEFFESVTGIPYISKARNG